MSVFGKPKWKSYSISDLYMLEDKDGFYLAEIKMPTASNEIREEMRKMFGDPIDDLGPIKYLMDRGYTEKQNGMLRPPLNHIPTDEEWACIEFLCDEWDFGYEPELPK